MASVNIGIGHDDDFMVAQFFYVKVFSKAGSKACDYRLQLVVVHYFFRAHFLNVEHFSPKRQNGLDFWVASFLCGAARRVALDYVDFAHFGVFERAVGKLFGQAKTVRQRLFAAGVLGLFGRDAGGGFRQGLVQKRFQNAGVLLKEERQLFLYKRVNNRSNFGVAELFLGLAFKLRLRHFH